MNGAPLLIDDRPPASPEPAELRAENARLKHEVAQLKETLAWFQRQVFGRKSEKRLEISPDQLELLAELAEASTPPSEPATEEIRYRRHKAKTRGPECETETGLRFDEQVPKEVIYLSAPELEGPEAEHFEIIREQVTYRLAQRPGAYVVLEYRQPVVKDRRDEPLSTPPAPASVLEHSVADVSLLAGLLVDKFVYHLPLYRQHQRLQDAGIQVSRASLSTWVERAIALLAPIEQAQREHILRSRVLAIDETPIKAGRKGKGQMRTGWYWPLYGEDDEIVFDYSASRGARHLHERLSDYQGVLLTDGYAAYERYAANRPEVSHAQCWTHTRRYFERARDSHPEQAEQALALIGGLYRIEAAIRDEGLDREQTLERRSRQAKPRVEALFEWVYQQRQRVDLVNSDPLAKALEYVSHRQAALSLYLGDPDVPIDTNHLERALRTIPMGRKNWLFCWSEAGARQVGIIQGLLTTCRLQGVDPYTYLVDVLQRISDYPARKVEDLTPRRWNTRFADAPLRSDLERLGKGVFE